jgi:hypothetical protein
MGQEYISIDLGEFCDKARMNKIFHTHLWEHHKLADWYIYTFLGYIPFTEDYFRHEMSIRELLKQAKDGDISYESSVEQLEKYVMYIRNEDMRQGGWFYTNPLNEKELHDYTNYLTPFISAARERLAKFMGYYPELIYSCRSELYIRLQMSHDTYRDVPEPTYCDARAMTAIEYRKVLLTKGADAADKSHLFGMLYREKDLRRLGLFEF